MSSQDQSPTAAPVAPGVGPGLAPRPHGARPRPAPGTAAAPHWLALRPAGIPPDAGRGQPSPQQQLAWWALQFSPRVCLLEEAVLLELSSCLRLFGGLRALHERIQREGRAQGLLPADTPAMAWAPNSLAALALLRGGRLNGLTRALAPLLDALPLPCLTAVQAESAMLARLGCRRLGDVRRLPRAGLARRFGAGLLLALDRAYGEVQQAHEWVRLPERFEARLELPWRLDDALALMPHAEHLLRSACAWLSGHQAGLSSLRLGWQHDAMRARDCPPGGELLLRSAELTRSVEHLQGLLREHLAQLSLPAPVAELRVAVDHIEPLRPPNADLRLDEHARTPAREPLGLLLERCAVRLGPARVCQSRPQADARPEAMQTLGPWSAPASGTARTPPPEIAWAGPQPSWLLEPPLRLVMSRSSAGSAQERPIYQGELQLLLGPQRVEGGWWGWPGQALPSVPGAQPPQVQRDYYLARNPQGQLLWIFRARGTLALAPQPGGPALTRTMARTEAAAGAAAAPGRPAGAPTRADASLSKGPSPGQTAAPARALPTGTRPPRAAAGAVAGAVADAAADAAAGVAGGAVADAAAGVAVFPSAPERPPADDAIHWYLHGLFA